jgi:ABC-type transport system substrate-binding protein
MYTYVSLILNIHFFSWSITFRQVSCDLKIIKNGHVDKALAELIDREGITKLVMRGAADERYSEYVSHT